MTNPKTPKDLKILEEKIIEDHQYYSKQALQKVIDTKKENIEKFLDCFGQSATYWQQAYEKIKEMIETAETPQALTATLTALEKCDTKLAMFLETPMTESAMMKEKELNFKQRIEVLKFTDLVKRYLQQAGIAVDIDSSVLEDVIVQAGTEVLVLNDQSKSKSESNIEPVDENDSDDSSSEPEKTSDI